jgi:hypothetical protein
MVGVFYYFRVSLASEQCRVKEQLFRRVTLIAKQREYATKNAEKRNLSWFRIANVAGTFRVSLASEQCRVKEQLIKVSLASHKITQYSVPVLILSIQGRARLCLSW